MQSMHWKDHLQPQSYPLNMITLVFTVGAVMVYSHNQNPLGFLYTLGIFALWALMSIMTEKYYGKKKVMGIEYYIRGIFIMSGFLVVIAYVLQALFGPM